MFSYVRQWFSFIVGCRVHVLTIVSVSSLLQVICLDNGFVTINHCFQFYETMFLMNNDYCIMFSMTMALYYPIT